MKGRQKEVIYTMSMVCVYEEREKVHSERERGKCVRPETTVYSDKPSIHYPPPISDPYVNKEYFFLHYTNDSAMTFIDE